MKRHAVVDSLSGGCTQRKAKFCTSWREKNRLPSWLTKSTHFEVQCLLQAMILVHVYRFTNLDSCVLFTDLQTSILVHVYRFTNLDSCVLFTDLQTSILVHVYRFRNLDSCARVPIYKPLFLCTVHRFTRIRFTSTDLCAPFTDSERIRLCI